MAVLDATQQVSDQATEQATTKKDSTNASQQTTDAAKAASSPNTWNAAETTAANVDTAGKDNLYADQTLNLPTAAANTDHSTASGAPSLTDITSLIKDSQNLITDVMKVTQDLDPTSSNYSAEMQTAFNAIGSTLKFDGQAIKSFAQGLETSAGSGQAAQPSNGDGCSGHGSGSGSQGSESGAGTPTAPPSDSGSTTPQAGSETGMGTSTAPPSDSGSTTPQAGSETGMGTPTAPPSDSGSTTPPAGSESGASPPAASDSGANPPTATENPPPTAGDKTGTGTTTVPPAGDVPATGQFSVQNGTIIGPDGKPFEAKGINVLGELSLQQENQVLQDFPGVNFIRLATGPDGGEMLGNNDGVPQIQQFINDMTSRGIVVDVEDHNDQMTALTGDALTHETDWYSQIASANKDNPYVWFGGMNEPGGDAGLQANQTSAIYNAVRSTGNNNMVMLETSGGGFSTNLAADAQDIANMHNVVVDAHFYARGGANYPNGTDDLPGALETEVNDAQQVQSADGKIPVVIGEFGNSTDGSTVDSNGDQVPGVIAQATQSGEISGGAAWLMGAPYNNAGDVLADNDGNITDYGQLVANWIATGTA